MSQSLDFQQLCTSHKTVSISGVWGSLRGLLAAALAQSKANLLFILPQAADADLVAGDAMAFGLADSYPLPLSSTEFKASSIRDEDYAERLQGLQQLRRRD